MIINIHAGHNPDGKIACGAVGLIKESTEARIVKNKVIEYIKQEGHTVYDCTVDDGLNQYDVLNKIVKKCNQHKVDIDVSIHFNSGRSDYIGDGSIGGSEIYVYSKNSGSVPYASRIANRLNGLGYKLRSDGSTGFAGVRVNSGLYVLNSTKSEALLVEVCFVDDKDDIKIYNADKVAKAIAEGILNKTISTYKDGLQDTPYKDGNYYYLKNGKVADITTIARNKYGWWYVEHGKVNFGFTGFAKNEYGWFFIEKGKCDLKHNGIFPHQNKKDWYYCEDSRVEFEYEGLCQNIYGWWYVKKGKVDFTYNGLKSNDYGTWVIKDGYVDFNYNGEYTYNNKKYTIKNGMVS